MLKNNIIQRWLNSLPRKQETQRQKNEEYLHLFLNFIKKNPKQILDEKKSLSKKEFKKAYSTYFSLFIEHLKNENLKPNSIREITEVVQLFFKYANLPLSLGFRGHFQLFLR